MTYKQKSNFNDIRSSNLSLVLRIVREQAPISRADIARQTGLTRSTASSLVDELIMMGYIEQIGLSNKPSVGKKATLLDIRSNKIFSIAVNFTGNDIVAAKINLRGDCINVIKRTLGEQSVKTIIEEVIQIIKEIIENIKEKEQVYCGIGVAFPGPVDNGTLMYPASFKNVEGFNLVDILSKEFLCTVNVENNADAAALAESWFGKYYNLKSLVYILIEQGIGCGIVINNELYYGCNRLSNESGHIIVKPDGPKCFCGNYGCLAAIASDRAILNMAPDDLLVKLSIVKDERPSTKDILKIIDYLQDHSKDFDDNIKEIAKYLGIGLANIFNALVPDIILVDGNLLNVPSFLDLVIESAREHIHPIFKNSLHIRPSQLGRNAAIIGAGTFLLKELYFNPLKLNSLTE